MKRALPLFALIFAVAGCGGKKGDTVTSVAESAPPVKGAVVETVSATSIPETIEVVGTVRARTSAVVSTRIPGSISVLRVREGDRVKKGQILAQLDARENQATAAVAVAGIDDARRALDESSSRKELADTTFTRYERLYAAQVVSRQEFDDRKTERDLAAQGLARAEARLRQAMEGSRAASAMADYTRIVAPVSGIITSKQADLGATVFPGQPLMTIEDEGSYQLELAIPENMAARVGPGTAVRVTLDADNSSFAARVDEVVPSADPVSRTFTAKINLARKGIRSGMFGRGAIASGTAVSGIVLAKKAVVERGALASLWVLDRSNSARMRLVKVGRTHGDRVEILSGLSAGERVVVEGLEKVTEGARVE